jgi:cystathionine beta-lyase
VLRSLPSIALRYRAHDRSARSWRAGCRARPEIAQVLHPALEGSPGHAHWRALCGPTAGRRACSRWCSTSATAPAQVDAFCDALRCSSWAIRGAAHEPGGALRHRPDAAAGQLAAPRHAGALLGRAGGAVADLQADLEQALRALA